LVNKAFLIGIREGEELKAPRHASAAAIRNGNLPSRDGSLPYLTATYLIPDTSNSSFIVAIYI
jgi:rhodanese-related sulfurtransferase